MSAPRWSRERGTVAATATIVLAGMVGVAGLSALQVRKSINVSAQQRSHTQALYAAESGVAAASAFLRRRIAQGANWGAYVSASNSSPVAPTDIVGNTDAPGTGENPFAATQSASYDVTLLNNVDDPGFSAGTDSDGWLLLRSVGHGPDGARVVLEVMISGTTGAPAEAICVGYAQQGLTELGSGRNDCLADINSGDSATYTPGVP
ncbi:MAG: hypothetical protein KBG28_06075 [Kofleriaceae bacterium]|nr:hypothetical protein [Kofleriaceae bacterium]MBP6835985.1 hypothetical protein [Kofleriaceae bacterium]MBP9203512.1 hypothetical protein [Kofleriaceae bacterium]